MLQFDCDVLLCLWQQTRYLQPLHLPIMDMKDLIMEDMNRRMKVNLTTEVTDHRMVDLAMEDNRRMEVDQAM